MYSLARFDLFDELLARGVRLHRYRTGDAVGPEFDAARADVDALEVGGDTLERRVVRQVGRAARTNRRDDLHDAPSVVEGDDHVGHHEGEVRHVEHVDRVPGNPLERSRGLVAYVADGSAHEQRQPRHARHTARGELSSHDPQRIIGQLAGEAAVLYHDLVATRADHGPVPDAEEAVATQPFAADDALEQECMLGAVGERKKRADRCRQVGVDLARDGDHIVIGGKCHELIPTRQNHARSSPSYSVACNKSPENAKAPVLQGTRAISRYHPCCFAGFGETT